MRQMYSLIKPIPNYPGYFISTNGKVYSDLYVGYRSDLNNIKRSNCLNELKPRLTNTGYARVCLRNVNTNKRVDLYIHRLVAEAFIDNPNNNSYVNHKNCIRNDNKVDNLEWVTAKQNTDQTLRLNHIVRDKYGKYKSNFDYKTQ